MTEQKENKGGEKKANRKEKAWYKIHLERKNKKRREMYAANAEYRSSCMAQSRAHYRHKYGTPTKDCRANIDNLASVGRIRLLRNGRGEVVKCLTFSTVEFANALGYSTIQVYRWQHDGRLPKPTNGLVYEEKIGGRFLCTRVYTEPEVRAIIEVLSEHQKRVSHYRTTHTATIKKLFSAVKKANMEG